MKTRTHRIGAAAAVALGCFGILSLTAVAHAGNLVTDGSFNLQPVGGDFNTYFAGQSFGGWNVTYGSVDLIGSYWVPENIGGQSVDMSGNSAGQIQQSVNLVAGQQYDLSFWMSGNPDGNPTIKQLSASVGGATLPDSFYSLGHNSDGNMNYNLYAYDFTATQTGANTLSFTSDTNSAYGPALSNVSLQPVPESSTVVTFAVALAAGGLMLVRKRTQTPVQVRVKTTTSGR